MSALQQGRQEAGAAEAQKSAKLRRLGSTASSGCGPHRWEREAGHSDKFTRPNGATTLEEVLELERAAAREARPLLPSSRLLPRPLRGARTHPRPGRAPRPRVAPGPPGCAARARPAAAAARARQRTRQRAHAAAAAAGASQPPCDPASSGQCSRTPHSTFTGSNGGIPRLVSTAHTDKKQRSENTFNKCASLLSAAGPAPGSTAQRAPRHRPRSCLRTPRGVARRSPPSRRARRARWASRDSPSSSATTHPTPSRAPSSTATSAARCVALKCRAGVVA